MSASKVERLLERALRAFRERKFSLAEKDWGQAAKLRPDDARIICNLGMAKTELGLFDDALECYTEAIRKDRRCARAYNNQAALLASAGAPPAAVLPSFIMALELSESYEDFGRHAINVCQIVAMGFDPSTSVLFDEMERHVISVSQRLKPKTPSAAHTLATFWPSLVAAYRQVAVYRTALAAKRWGDADAALKQAYTTFTSIGMDKFAEDLASHRKLFDLAKAIYAFLEKIATNPDLDPARAFAHGKDLHAKAVALAKEPDFQSNSLLHCFGWFLMLLGSQTGVLAGQLVGLPKIDCHVQTMIWLSSASFALIGNELISILNFIDGRLQAFASHAHSIADPRRIERLRIDEWTRIALFVNGQILGFAEIEAAVARSTLRWNSDPMQKIRTELHEFRSFVERQAYRDIFVDGRAMENIARTLLQARLTARSYREVPTRGGRSDILAFSGGTGRILIEAKIWRGAEYHETGIKELGEYVKGENDDRNLLGVFYVVFDPTASQRAAAHAGGTVAARSIAGVSIEILTISLAPPTPSRMK